MSSNETVGINLRMNTKGIEKELKTIDDRLKKLKTEKPSIELRAEKLKLAKTEISKVNIELKELSAKKALIKADTTDVEKGKKQIAEINTQMDKLKARKAVLHVSTEKLKGADRDAKNLSKEMTQLNNRKAILQVDAEDAVKAEEQMDRLTDKIHEVNTTKASVNMSSMLSGIGGGLQGAGDKLLSLNPLNSVAGKVLGIGAAVKVVDAGVSQLKNSVSGAISRFDTMEKYPKVMQSLGFEAKQSEDSIKALGDGIDGLPTTLDNIVAANQQMVSTTGDINKGTQATIALNNAFLASGADYEKSQRGTAQYLKMLSRGEVDLVSWRTLIDTMPVSLTKVANAFEFTGESAKNDLYDALNAGTITFDQFQDKLIQLGTGTGELAELAKINSEGIATSFENLKNSTTKGMANVLGKFSETVKEVTGKNIPQHLDSFKGVINNVFDNINKNMDKTKPFIEKGVQLAESFIEKFKSFNWKGFFDGMKEGFTEVKNVGVALFNTFVKPLAKLFGKGDISKRLGKLPFQLFLLGHGLKFAGGGFKLLGGGFSILEKLSKFKGINLPFLKEGAQKVSPKVDLLNNLKGTASSLASGAKNLALVYGAIKVVEEAAEAIKQLDEKIPDNFLGLARKIGAMSLGIDAIGGLAVIAGKLPKEVLIKGLATVAVVSLEIMLAAEAIRQLDQKIPDDFIGVMKKIGTMAADIGAMTLLVGAVGLVATIGAGVLIPGLITVAAVSLEIMLAAEALRQLDEKVPDNMKKVAKKIGSLAIAIGAMTALDIALGGETLIFVPLIGLGALVSGVVSAEILVAAEAIKQLDEKVPSDFGQIKLKLETLTETLKVIKDSFGGIGNILKSFTSKLSLSNLKGSASSIVEIAETLDKAATNGHLDADFSGIKPKLKKMFEILEYLKEETATNLKGLVESFVGKLSTDNLVETTGSLAEIGGKIATLDKVNFDSDTVTEKVIAVKTVLKELSEDKWADVTSGFVKAKMIDKLDTVIFRLGTLANRITQLESAATFDYSTVSGRILAIRNVAKELTTDKWSEITSNVVNARVIKRTGKTMTQFTELANQIKTLSTSGFEEESAFNVITSVKRVLGELKDFPTGDGTDSINTVIESFNTLVTNLNAMQASFKPIGKGYGEKVIAGFKSANVPSKIVKVIDNLITALRNKTEKFREIGRTYGNALKDGFSNGLKGMNGAINSRIKNLEGKAELFGAVGTSYGDALKTSFETALEGLETTITKLRNQITDLPDLPSPGKKPPKKKKKKGRSRTSYFADGGFVPRGTDTVPAMLTPGEYVQNRQAVQTFGKDFMDKVNNLDIQGVLKQTYSRFDTSAMYHAPVVNNIHNVTTNNNANVTQKIQQAAPDYSLKRAAFSLQHLT